VKITYFSKYSQLAPSSRFRLFQFLDSFQKAGVDLNVQILFDDSYFRFLREPSNSIKKRIQKTSYVASRFGLRMSKLRQDRSELAIIEQQLFPYLPFPVEKRFLPKNYLVEFDDAIYLTHPRKLPKVIQHASGVIAGNRTLADYSKQYNQNVHIVPTVLDSQNFQPRKKTERDKLIIGWSGIEYNFKYIRTLGPIFNRLAKKYPVEIVILAASPPRDFDFPFTFEKWNEKTEVDQIGQFDIAVMPLEMDEWCKGKCGLKLLQYMSLEIPSIATPIGVNSEIVIEGENGFTAITQEEWEQSLVRIIEDSYLRTRLGKAARQTVVDHYSLEVWFPKILNLYKSYCDGIS
jgi:glycosyltransferase involved in cell wall biosynthesis